jgi:dipeptidase E
VEPRLHLFVNGGGDASDTAQIDRKFVGALGDGPLLYWPFARAQETYARCLDWFTSLFTGLGVTSIEMWSQLDKEPRSLSHYGGLYIGGGDTYRLFTSLLTSGFDRVLVDAATGGLPVFGGSAGAIILGADIATWVPDGAERPPVEAARGLNLLGGYSVWPEYDMSHGAATREWLASRPSPLLGLGCAAGVIVTNGKMYACGREPVVRIDASGATSVEDGDRIAARSALPSI